MKSFQKLLVLCLLFMGILFTVSQEVLANDTLEFDVTQDEPPEFQVMRDNMLDPSDLDIPVAEKVNPDGSTSPAATTTSVPKEVTGLEKGYIPVFSGTGVQDGIWTASLNIKGAYKETSIIRLIAGWIRFALPIIAFLTFIVMLVAGWFFVTSGGDDGRHDAAKKTIIWAVIGLIVVMGSYALINTWLGGIT